MTIKLGADSYSFQSCEVNIQLNTEISNQQVQTTVEENPVFEREEKF